MAGSKKNNDIDKKKAELVEENVDNSEQLVDSFASPCNPKPTRVYSRRSKMSNNIENEKKKKAEFSRVYSRRSKMSNNIENEKNSKESPWNPADLVEEQIGDKKKNQKEQVVDSFAGSVEHLVDNEVESTYILLNRVVGKIDVNEIRPRLKPSKDKINWGLVKEKWLDSKSKVSTAEVPEVPVTGDLVFEDDYLGNPLEPQSKFFCCPDWSVADKEEFKSVLEEFVNSVRAKNEAEEKEAKGTKKNNAKGKRGKKPKEPPGLWDLLHKALPHKPDEEIQRYYYDFFLPHRCAENPKDDFEELLDF